MFRRPPPFREPTDAEESDSLLMIAYHQEAAKFYGARASTYGRRSTRFAIAAAVCWSFSLLCQIIGLIYGS